MAPLQKRSLYALLLEIIWASAIIVVFVSQGGATKYNTNADFRLIMDGMWVGGLIFYWWLFSSLNRHPEQFDERDKTIMERAVKVQWWAVIFSLVAWVIGLSEHYHAKARYR
jgi:tellurite resistance protein TehA-like permease